MYNTLSSQDGREIVEAVGIVHASQERTAKAYYDALALGSPKVDDLRVNLDYSRRETAKAIPAIMRSSLPGEARRIAAEFQRVFH
jgi:hypothetical protein